MFSPELSRSSFDTTFGDARWQNWLDLSRSGLLSGRGIPLGTYEPAGLYPTDLFYNNGGHLMTTAKTRRGKMTTLLAKAVLGYDASLLCLDPKGELAAICSRARRDVLRQEVRHLNPYGLFTDRPWCLRQDRLNPLAVINPESPNFVADVLALCDALIVTQGKDPHWSDSARMLCSGIIMESVIREGPAATLPKMREKLLLGREPWLDYIETVKQPQAGEHPSLKVARGILMRFVNDGDELQSIRSTAQAQSKFLDDPALAACLSKDDFRPGDLKTRPLSIFVILPAPYVQQYSRFMRIFVASALNTLMSTPAGSSRNVLFLMDEFVTSLGYLSIIETAMNMAAGFGVQLWPVIQDLGSLQRVYQRGWSTFFSAVGLTQLFGVDDLETAEYFSRRCGQLTAEVITTSYQTSSGYDYYRPQPLVQSTSRSIAGRPLITPQQIIDLDPERDRQILFVSGHADPIYCTRSPYFRDPIYRSLADPNPYYKAE